MSHQRSANWVTDRADPHPSPLARGGTGVCSTTSYRRSFFSGAVITPMPERIRETDRGHPVMPRFASCVSIGSPVRSSMACPAPGRGPGSGVYSRSMALFCICVHGSTTLGSGDNHVPRAGGQGTGVGRQNTIRIIKNRVILVAAQEFRVEWYGLRWSRLGVTPRPHRYRDQASRQARRRYALRVAAPA